MSLSFVLVVTSKFSYWFSIGCFQRRQLWLWGRIQGPGQVVVRRFETPTFLRYRLCKSSPLCLAEWGCCKGSWEYWCLEGKWEVWEWGHMELYNKQPPVTHQQPWKLNGEEIDLLLGEEPCGHSKVKREKWRLTFQQERHLGFSHHVRETCTTQNSTFSPSVFLSLHLSPPFWLYLFDLIYNLFRTPQTYHCVLFTDCLLCFSSLVQHHTRRAPAVIYA